MVRIVTRLSRFFCVFVMLFYTNQFRAQVYQFPEAFEFIETEIGDVVLDIRYHGKHNFIGSRIDGYESDKPVITKQALKHLVVIQEELSREGLGLKIFDAYRPQRAVDHFVRWSLDVNDTLMKHEFYPNLTKDKLFEKEYIAYRSGHSRGSTVDLTLVSKSTGEELDMGSAYDFFGEISWPFTKEISEEQRANRMLLRRTMLSNGFKPYDQEWWHFTLEEEPFPDTYFDFVVE